MHVGRREGASYIMAPMKAPHIDDGNDNHNTHCEPPNISTVVNALDLGLLINDQ